MEQQYYSEMVEQLDRLIDSGRLQNKAIYLFGHCNATEELMELMFQRGLRIEAILDNSAEKSGMLCKGVEIKNPASQIADMKNDAVVCIVSRAYSAMREQLYCLGFAGEIYRLVDYNTYAEYSLVPHVIADKQERVVRGLACKDALEKKYPGYFKVLCPFLALGDIFFTMSYLPQFLTARRREHCVVCVPGNACRQVAEIFGTCPVEAFAQRELDELIQACLYAADENFFIAHQDRPYVIDLHKALYRKCIPLEMIYKCGIFGLPKETKPYMPSGWKDYPGLEEIERGKAVILAPYAKSVTALDRSFWQSVVMWYRERGYQCFTNVAGEEAPLEGTLAIRPLIAEMQSVVERAGTFIGIRSGLCDVIRYARGRKVALYPDYYYSDTRWKAIDMYAIEGWENVEAGEGYIWRGN